MRGSCRSFASAPGSSRRFMQRAKDVTPKHKDTPDVHLREPQWKMARRACTCMQKHARLVATQGAKHTPPTPTPLSAHSSMTFFFFLPISRVRPRFVGVNRNLAQESPQGGFRGWSRGRDYPQASGPGISKHWGQQEGGGYGPLPPPSCCSATPTQVMNALYLRGTGAATYYHVCEKQGRHLPCCYTPQLPW